MYAILLKMCFGNQTKLQTYLFSEIFNLLTKTPKLHWQQGPMNQSRAKIPSIHLVFYGKSPVETDLTWCGKNLAEPVKALSMTSSEQWHTYYWLSSGTETTVTIPSAYPVYTGAVQTLMGHKYSNRKVQKTVKMHLDQGINSLRRSDAYMRRYKYQHWFR